MKTTVVVVHERYSFTWEQGQDEVEVCAPSGSIPHNVVDRVRLAPGYGITAVEETARRWVEGRGRHGG